MTSSCNIKSVDIVAEEAAVRATFEETIDAFSSKDWDRYSKLWIHEPYLQVVHPPQRDWITGWNNFETSYKKLIASDVQFTFKVNRMDIKVSPTGDTAWTTVEAVLNANGQSVISWQMAVLQKIDGKWRYAALFASSLPPE